MNIDIIIEKLKQMTNKALKANEVPVAAIIVENDNIIAEAYNYKNTTQNPLNHAEILCILEAVKKKKYWRLNGCSMYVTLEPCKMCKDLIESVGINEVHYFVKSKENNYNNETIYIKEECDAIEFENELVEFFKKIRKE